jgi:hypothetical protein
MEKNKNQRPPDPGQKGGKPNRQEHINKGRYNSRQEPAGPGAEHTPSGNSDHNTASGQLKKTVTNHDAQRKITNSGNADDVMGEQETEGDRRRNERFRSYKTTEDDFLKHFERKTPTMD